MRLFLTIEGQNCTETGLADTLGAIVRELDFVTNKNSELDDVNNYGTEFRTICIIPTCADDGFWQALGWKDRKQIWRKKQEADIRLRMDHELYISADEDTRRLLLIDVIIRSIRVVQEKSKEDFDGDRLIHDIMEALNISQQQLDKANS